MGIVLKFHVISTFNLFHEIQQNDSGINENLLKQNGFPGTWKLTFHENIERIYHKRTFRRFIRVFKTHSVYRKKKLEVDVQ